jgi:hypothetical protein
MFPGHDRNVGLHTDLLLMLTSAARSSNLTISGPGAIHPSTGSAAFCTRSRPSGTRNCLELGKRGQLDGGQSRANHHLGHRGHQKSRKASTLSNSG